MVFLCSKCGEEKPTSEFPKDKSIKRGFKSYCKSCSAIMKRNWYKRKMEENPNYNKDKYWENPEYYRANAKRWRDKNREKARRATREWYKKNKHKRAERHRREYWEEGGRERQRVERFLYGFIGQSSTGKRRRFAGYLLTQGICLICRELNPLLMVNAHIFPDNDEDLISLCWNCHRMVDRYPSFLDL
jgi:hypothetical protein